MSRRIQTTYIWFPNDVLASESSLKHFKAPAMNKMLEDPNYKSVSGLKNLFYEEKKKHI